MKGVAQPPLALARVRQPPFIEYSQNDSFFMDDLSALDTDALKARVGHLRRYL